jgi:hypothetical protein
VFDFDFAAEASPKVVNRFTKQVRCIPSSLLGGHSVKNLYIANNFSEDLAAISSYTGILNLPITILFSQSRVDALSKQSPAKRMRLKGPTNAWPYVMPVPAAGAGVVKKEPVADDASVQDVDDEVSASSSSKPAVNAKQSELAIMPPAPKKKS